VLAGDAIELAHDRDDRVRGRREVPLHRLEIEPLHPGRPPDRLGGRRRDEAELGMAAASAASTSSHRCSIARSSKIARMSGVANWSPKSW
jgi:hypothetical protein